MNMNIGNMKFTWPDALTFKGTIKRQHGKGSPPKASEDPVDDANLRPLETFVDKDALDDAMNTNETKLIAEEEQNQLDSDVELTTHASTSKTTYSSEEGSAPSSPMLILSSIPIYLAPPEQQLEATRRNMRLLTVRVSRAGNSCSD